MLTMDSPKWTTLSMTNAEYSTSQVLSLLMSFPSTSSTRGFDLGLRTKIMSTQKEFKTFVQCAASYRKNEREMCLHNDQSSHIERLAQFLSSSIEYLNVLLPFSSSDVWNTRVTVFKGTFDKYAKLDTYTRCRDQPVDLPLALVPESSEFENALPGILCVLTAMGFSEFLQKFRNKDHAIFQGIFRRTNVEVTIWDNTSQHPCESPAYRLVELQSKPSNYGPFIGRLDSVQFNEASKADFIQISDKERTYNVTTKPRPHSSASIIFEAFGQRLSQKIPSDQDLEEIQNVLIQCLRLVFCAHSDGIVIRACPSTWHLISIHDNDSKKYIAHVKFNGEDFALVWGGSLHSEFSEFEYHDSSCPIYPNFLEQSVETASHVGPCPPHSARRVRHNSSAFKYTVVSDENVRLAMRRIGHKKNIRFAGGPELPEFCTQARAQCQCCPIPSKNMDMRLTGLLFLKVLSGGRLQDSNFQSPLELLKSLHLGTKTATLNALFGVDSLDMVSSLDSIRHLREQYVSLIDFLFLLVGPEPISAENALNHQHFGRHINAVPVLPRDMHPLLQDIFVAGRDHQTAKGTKKVLSTWLRVELKQINQIWVIYRSLILAEWGEKDQYAAIYEGPLRSLLAPFSDMWDGRWAMVVHGTSWVIDSMERGDHGQRNDVARGTMGAYINSSMVTGCAGSLLKGGNCRRVWFREQFTEGFISQNPHFVQMALALTCDTSPNTELLYPYPWKKQFQFSEEAQEASDGRMSERSAIASKRALPLRTVTRKHMVSKRRYSTDSSDSASSVELQVSSTIRRPRLLGCCCRCPHSRCTSILIFYSEFYTLTAFFASSQDRGTSSGAATYQEG